MCHFVYKVLYSNTFRYIIFFVILACSPGEYGRNCQFRCSDHCHNNEVCNPFFGNCSKCGNGYQNAKCNERKFFLYQSYFALSVRDMIVKKINITSCT